MSHRAPILWALTACLPFAQACAADTSPREWSGDVPAAFETAPESMPSSPSTTDSERLALEGVGGRKTMGTTPLPCDLGEVLATSCHGCHAADPGLQAPMALVSLEDLMAPAVSDQGRRVLDLMRERVHSEVTPMPPPSSRRLTESELAVIDRMTAAGTTGTLAACATAAEEPPGSSPPADMGTCYTLQVHEHAVAGDTTPHVVEPGEHYSCFYFDVPWPAGAQALSVRTNGGPSAHHLELFHFEDATPAGSVLRQQPHCGYAPRVPVSIWGLGQRTEQNMPEDVGLELPAPSDTRRLYLEVHYANPGEPLADTSSVEICTAKAPRTHAAGVTVLGASPFTLQPGQEATVSATCTPAHSGDIHVLRSLPHMHARGRSFESLVARADGSLESIVDIAYDVNNQRTYDLDVVLNHGDRLLSRCHYVNDTDRAISTGYTSDDEMCNHFVYAWPAGALTNGVLGIPGACLY